MSTHVSPSSILACRTLPFALVLTACAGDVTEPSPAEPTAPSASAAVAPRDVPQPTQAPAAAPTEAAPAEPAPPLEPPPPANAAPAELRLTAYGRCRYMGVSAVDGRSLLHYRWGEERGFVHRMDEHGRIAETMRFDEGFHWDEKNPGPWKMRYFELEKVAGRWPDQLMLLASVDYRENEVGHLWRRIDDGWKRVETLGYDVIYQDVWPWHDGSILAWAHTDFNEDKRQHWLAVVRGEGKGPSLALLRKRSRCDAYAFAITDVHVQGDGKVLALASCGGTWLATWTPDDLEGTVQRLAQSDGWSSTLHIDARGQGYVLNDGSLVAWDGATATPVKAPGGRKVEKVFVGRDGETWVLQGRTLSRRTDAGWEPVAVPEGSPVTHVAGLEHGTPWLLHKDGTLSMQTADGAWHPVALPPTPDLNKVPRATTIRVVAPGDAWVEGTYFKMNKGSKHVGKPFWAAFTTRDAPTAWECGQEPSPTPAAAPAPAKEQAP